MAFDSSEKEPLVEPQQQQQAQAQQQYSPQPIYAQQPPQQQYIQQQPLQYVQSQPQYIQPPMGKHKITQEIGCGFNRLSPFLNAYPAELSNCLSCEEYSFIISTLNHITQSFRKKNIIIAIIYFILQVGIVGLLVTGATTNSFPLIIIYISLNFVFIMTYVFLLIFRRNKLVRDLQCTASQINAQYANRNIRVEITYHRAVRGYIYYPYNVVYVQQQQQVPQMYAYQQPQPQFVQQQQPQQPQQVPQQTYNGSILL